MVERQPSKLRVAGSNPVSRSKECEVVSVAARENSYRGLARHCFCAHVAQSVEHILGKDEVTGSIPVMGL